MTNYQMLNEIGGIKTRLTNLQVQSNALKQNFFDYIEGLSSEYKLLENINRDDFSFEIFGNKLKIKSTYDSKNSSFQGKFSIMVQSIINGVITFNEIFYLNFDRLGNVKFPEDQIAKYYYSDFAESFYIALMIKLIESDNFEL